MADRKVKLDFGDSSDEDEQKQGLTINANYAERYDNWRRLEELQKMKDKYGEAAVEDEETSSSEEEPEWTADDEKGFLAALSALKGDAPDLYDKSKRFFKEPTEESVVKEKKKEPKKTKKDQVKPVYLKDYERQLVLERGGDIDEDDIGDEEDEAGPSGGETSGAYFEQQEKNRQALKAALAEAGEGESDEGLLKKREKTKEEVAREEDEYYEWLKGQRKECKDQKELKGLKKVWTDPNIDKDDAFLRDYLLNRDYEVGHGEAEIPTYEDIVALDEDERELDKQSQFEHKYNFRFEDPDQEFIKQYPRTVAESMRPGNEKRKQKREEYKERKEREKEEKKREIGEMKRMKKAEIEQKLAKLRKLAGDDIALKVEDLEGDFDPKEYDRRMRELFNKEYYDKEEGERGEDVDKPVFSDLSSDEESSVSDYDQMPISETTRKAAKKQKKKKKEGGEEDEGDEEEESQFREKTPKGRRKKRNSRFAEAVQREKPLFDPNEKTFEEYFNEYYALDYEDILGDIRTRFKYREVPANSFGLSTEEILAADDRQLNAWASIKKATSYRSQKEEQYDIQAYEKKARNMDKKKRIFSTDFGGKKSKKLKDQGANEKKEGEEENKEEGEKTLKKRKKNKKKKQNGEPNGAAEEVHKEQEEEVEKKGKKVRSRKRRRPVEEELGVDDTRLAAYGLNPKKFKNKIAHKKKS